MPYTNLVFEGGGVKGIAHIGALLELEENGIDLDNIKRVAGTSVGAIIALMVALDYSSKDIEDILSKMSLSKFIGSNIKNNISDLRKTSIKEFGRRIGKRIKKRKHRRILGKPGVFPGKGLYEELGVIIERKTGSKDTTFQQLQNISFSKELYIIVTNLSKRKIEIFSFHGHNFPNTKLRDAVKMSITIPLFFEWYEQGKDIIVDGGLAYTYPIDIFDYHTHEDLMNFNRDNKTFNEETLGIRLSTKKDLENRVFFFEDKIDNKMRDNWDYLTKVIGFLVETSNDWYTSTRDPERTIYLDTSFIKNTHFHKLKKMFPRLIKSGREGTKKFIKRKGGKL